MKISSFINRKISAYNPIRLLLSILIPYILALTYLYNETFYLPMPIIVGFCIILFIWLGISISKNRLSIIIYIVLGLFGLFLGIWRFNNYYEHHIFIDKRAIGNNVEVVGVVDNNKQRIKYDDKNYYKFIFKLEGVKAGNNTCKEYTNTNGSIYIYLPENKVKDIYYGDKLVLKGNIKPINLYYEKGSIDLRDRYIAHEITGTMFDPKVENIDKAHKNIYYYIYRLRDHIGDEIQQYLPGQVGVIFESLIFGADYNSIDPVINDSYAKTGLIHILSVSGSHITILIGAYSYLLSKLGVRRKKALILSCFGVLLYAAIVGASPPVIRATSTGILAAVGIFLGYRYAAIQGLNIILWCNLLYDPLAIGDISFQFSYIASYSLIILYRPLSNNLRFLPAVIRALFTVTLCAQLLVIPLQVYYFQIISPVTFVANILVGPILELVITSGIFLLSTTLIFKFLLVHIGLNFVFNHLFEPLFKICFSLLANLIVLSTGLIITLSRLPGAYFYCRGFRIWEIISYYISMTVLFIYLKYYLNLRHISLVIIFFVFSNAVINYFYNQMLKIEFLEYPNIKLVHVQNRDNNQMILAINADELTNKRQLQRIISFMRYYGIEKTELFITEYTNRFKQNQGHFVQRENNNFEELKKVFPKIILGKINEDNGHHFVLEKNGFISAYWESKGHLLVLLNGQKMQKIIESNSNKVRIIGSFNSIPKQYTDNTIVFAWPSPYGGETDADDDSYYLVGKEKVSNLYLR